MPLMMPCRRCCFEFISAADYADAMMRRHDAMMRLRRYARDADTPQH